ncbi:hypothetical protein TNCV_2486961 [Trichonephila clavipes]|uniref:Uncharacterized protein n=1 Tax=Trichonephila clavipes TaxID=2585209 RepID=A0A8X7BB18_TRICX|nr:hypothetical protein TNCV_2486961 [Trichonephila clavipes]
MRIYYRKFNSLSIQDSAAIFTEQISEGLHTFNSTQTQLQVSKAHVCKRLVACTAELIGNHGQNKFTNRWLNQDRLVVTGSALFIDPAETSREIRKRHSAEIIGEVHYFLEESRGSQSRLQGRQL